MSNNTDNIWCPISNPIQFFLDLTGGYMYVTSIDANGVDSNITKVNMADGSIVNDKWCTIPNTTALGKITINGDSLYVLNADDIVQVSLADGSITNSIWFTGLIEPIEIYSNTSSLYVVAYNPFTIPDTNETFQTSIYVINLDDGTLIKQDSYFLGKVPIHVFPVFYNEHFYNLTPNGIVESTYALPYVANSN